MKFIKWQITIQGFTPPVRLPAYFHEYWRTLIIEEKIVTSQLWRQKIEDKPANFEDMTLPDEEIEGSFMCREPWPPRMIYYTCLKIIVIDVKSCPFITQGKIITMPRFWFAFQMSLTYHMRAGGWRWMKFKNDFWSQTSFCGLCVLHQLLTQP